MWWEWSSPVQGHPSALTRRPPTIDDLLCVLLSIPSCSHSSFPPIATSMRYIIVCDYYLFKIGSFTQQQHSTTFFENRGRASIFKHSKKKVCINLQNIQSGSDCFECSESSTFILILTWKAFKLYISFSWCVLLLMWGFFIFEGEWKKMPQWWIMCKHLFLDGMIKG